MGYGMRLSRLSRHRTTRVLRTGQALPRPRIMERRPIPRSVHPGAVMRSLVTVAVSLGCLLAGTARAAAQEPPPKEELVEQVRQAIERGERFLRQQEGGKGNW